MKIGIDARLYGTHHRGIGRYTFNLIKELQRLDTKNCYSLFGDPKIIDDLPNNWRIINARPRVYSINEQLRLPRLFRQANLDLVHFPHWNVPLRYRRPYVVTIHDLILHHFPSERATTLPLPIYKFKLALSYLTFKRAVAGAQKIITVSQTTANDLASYYPEVKNKIEVIYEAPTIDGHMDGQSPGNRLVAQPYLLNVGAAYPHKNLELLIDAHQQLLRDYPNLKLILVGRRDYFYQRLEQQLINQNKNKQVVFWGEADDLTLTTLFRQAKVYITPSLAEGFNLGAVEALSFNLPVVASDINIHREILDSAVAYFNYNSSDSLFNVLKTVLAGEKTDFSFLKEIPRVLSRYSWQQVARQTLNCYESALSQIG
ncbi:MAG: glycosyltransferase family 1 protein [Patescibacteria group bacterium]